ncbi:hypothetical protein KR074_005807 [Drosophila pseudoananassae]|nr:hypothetical protein KR074_005807 [Drosophila pseudoananassae]
MLWWLLLLAGQAEGALLPVEPYRTAPLARAALAILKEQVSPSQSTLSVMELKREDEHSDNDEEDLMTSVLTGLGDSMALRIYQKPPDEIPSSHVLFLVHSAEAFGSLNFNFSGQHSSREYNFLILLTQRMSSPRNRLQALREISRACVRFHILNVILLSQKVSSVVLTYGFKIYNEKCDLNINLELLDRYERGAFRKSRKERTFDRILRNMSGCPLKVSWYPLEPFVSFRGNTSDAAERAQIWRLTGIDGELIKLLAEIFNFRIQLEEPCDKCLSHDIKDGCSGCFDQMINQTSSILIGAMSGSHQHREHFSPTTAYYQSSMVFVLHMETQWGAVAQLAVPFCSTVWVALVVSCVLLVLVLCASWMIREQGPADVSSHFLQVLTTLIGNPMVTWQLPRSWKTKMLYAIWLLLALVLRVIYQGKLFDSFRQPFSKALPGDISQLIEGNYTLISQEYLDFYPRSLTVLTRNGSKDRFDHIQAVGEHARLTTTSLISSMTFYNLANWNTSRLTLIKEHILLYQLVFYLRRHSILKFAFDRKIKQLQSAGIVGYYVREFDRSQYRVSTVQSHEVSALRIEIFCGLYYVSSIWLSAAVVAFVLELLSLRITWLRRYFQ